MHSFRRLRALRERGRCGASSAAANTEFYFPGSRRGSLRRAGAREPPSEEAEAAARAAFSLATKNRMKIDEHKAVWLAEDAKAQDARAEGELEDFTVRKLEI